MVLKIYYRIRCYIVKKWECSISLPSTAPNIIIGLSVNHRSNKWMKTNTTTDAWGGVTDTKVYLYGSGNCRMGLLVEVCQKNSTDNEEVNAVVILAHYFANSSGTAFNRSTESDIGLSNAISIVNDGRFRGHANGSSIRCKYFYANN